jgi:hypothetical protein
MNKHFSPVLNFAPLKVIIFALFLCSHFNLSAQTDSLHKRHKPLKTKPHKNTKNVPAQDPAQAKRKEAVRRILKEKNFHFPDTMKKK